MSHNTYVCDPDPHHGNRRTRSVTGKTRATTNATKRRYPGVLEDESTVQHQPEIPKIGSRDSPGS
jgi:hypothetical protein